MAVHGRRDDSGSEPVTSLPITSVELARYVFTPGDPARVARIAAHWDAARHFGTRGASACATGTAGGVAMSAVSTGIGGPPMAAVATALAALGADTLVRLGTAGPVPAEGLAPGELVIAHAAIRDEGTSRTAVPAAVPALADPAVTAALSDAAAELGVVHRVGVVQSKDAFYGELEPDRQPVAADLARRWESWRRGGALASEMEAASLFVVAQALGLRVGAAVVIVPCPPAALEALAAVGVRAVQLLAARDAGADPARMR